MKKTTKLLVAALICGTFATQAVAQFYIGAQAGYSFSTAPSVLGNANTSNSTSSPTTNIDANIYGSNGGGTSFGANIGYMLGEHFGIDVAANYLMIAAQKTESISSTDLGSTSEASNTTSGTQLRITPSLVVVAGKEGLQPYARFGVVLPISGSTITDVSIVTKVPSLSKTYTTTAKVETMGQMSLGFNSAIGVNFALGEKLSLFGEVALTTLSIKGATSTLKAYNSEGLTGTTTLADFADVYDKEITYVDALSKTSNNDDAGYNSSANIVRTKAKDELAKVANYNTLGLNVGVKFSF